MSKLNDTLTEDIDVAGTVCTVVAINIEKKISVLHLNKLILTYPSNEGTRILFSFKEKRKKKKQ